MTDRRCVKQYVIPPVLPHEKPVVIEKGQVIIIPIHGPNMDEKYFPEPQKFDPERFNDENKHNIKPGVYKPFGIGPRNCIGKNKILLIQEGSTKKNIIVGSRFALLEMKTLLFHIIRNFEITPNKKTQIPLIHSKSGFNFSGRNGTWVDFKVRC